MNRSEAYEASVPDEFKEPLLPLEDLDENLLDAKTPRRDFLKYLGFSTVAAALAAGCQAAIPLRPASATEPQREGTRQLSSQE